MLIWKVFLYYIATQSEVYRLVEGGNIKSQQYQDSNQITAISKSGRSYIRSHSDFSNTQATAIQEMVQEVGTGDHSVLSAKRFAC
jgi:hypothetical protein